MLNINNNYIFIIMIYINLLFVELFHFGSDVYIIIMWESFLCFTIILYFLSSGFKEIFLIDLQCIVIKYNYIYILFKKIVNLNVDVYNIFINIYLLLLYYLFKNEGLIQNYKNKLKIEYIKTLIFLKNQLSDVSKYYLKRFSYEVNLFI